MADGTEPKLAVDETKKVTEQAPAEAAEKNKENTSLSGLASQAGSSAAETAQGVKDNVFSMFGGGQKKEKKEEPDDVDEPSGSSKKKSGDDVRPSISSTSAT